MESTPQSAAGRLAPELARTLAGRRVGLLGFGAEESGRIAAVLEPVGAVWSRFESNWVSKSVYVGDALLVKMAAVDASVWRAAALSGVPVLIVAAGAALLEGTAGAYAWAREILVEPWSEAELLVRLFRALARGRSPAAGCRTQPLVLIADDDPTWNALVEATLRVHGFGCRTVADGLGALRLARELHPDLVVLDVQMPGMDGFEVLEAMRRDPVLEALPAALLTGCVDEGEVSRGSALDADDYIAKPVSPTVLLNRIRKLLPAPGSGVVPEHARGSDTAPSADEQTGPPAGLEELRASYLSHRTRELANLAAALQRSDFEVLGRAAHNLKGTGAAYGFDELSEIGKALEEAAKNKNTPEAQVLLGRAESYLKHVDPAPAPK